MWIRSQNKESLLICTDIRIINHYQIWDMARDEKLGSYETRERAMQILTEIEEALFHSTGNIIFQMPTK